MTDHDAVAAFIRQAADKAAASRGELLAAALELIDAQREELERQRAELDKLKGGAK